MDPFTASYLSGVAASLTTELLNASGRRVKNSILGTEKEQALRRAVQAGIAAMVAEAERDSKAERDLLYDIFREFFESEDLQSDIAKALEPLTKGQRADVEELLYLFEEAGYDPKTLPGLKFEDAVAAFETAYLAVVKGTPELREELKADVLLELLSAQRETATGVTEISGFLKGVNLDSMAVKAGKIIAETLQGEIKSFTWPVFEMREYVGERSYLEEIVSEANILPWSHIFSEYADPRKGVEFRLEDVYTSLDTTELEHVERELDYRNLMKDVARGGVQRVSALKMLNAHGRLLPMGDPGAGKSTFAKYVAYGLARARLERQSGWLEKLEGWEHGALLPVFVELRELAAYARRKGLKRGNFSLFREYLTQHLTRRLDGVRNNPDGGRRQPHGTVLPPGPEPAKRRLGRQRAVPGYRACPFRQGDGRRGSRYIV